MKNRRLFQRIKNDRRGQSFVELMIVVLILALLLAGVVEFGFLMTNYFHVLDAAREAARSQSTNEAFDKTNGNTQLLFYYNAVTVAGDTMFPVVLDPNHGDDIVISVFSVTNGIPKRYPLDGGGNSIQTGWSLCENYAGYVTYMLTSDPLHPYTIPPALLGPGWDNCSASPATYKRLSQMSTAEIQSKLNPTAPQTGVLLVEIIYDYPQLLKLPVFNNSIYSAIPDPIPLYLYSVMPLSSAEPTPTH
jgi:hypothetical protein